MSAWKVTLAALVIFCTGFFAGVLFPHASINTSLPVPRATAPPPIMPDGRRYEVVRRMTHELGLSEEQKQKVDVHIRESQDRTRVIWELVGPEVQEEFLRLRTDVGQELTPEQRKQFESKLRRVRKNERIKSEETNAPASVLGRIHKL